MELRTSGDLKEIENTIAMQCEWANNMRIAAEMAKKQNIPLSEELRIMAKACESSAELSLALLRLVAEGKKIPEEAKVYAE